jgi:glycosyltransferase involved in cell wall biosynthesis
LERRTWSGTPRNLCDELSDRGALGAAFDAGPSSKSERLLYKGLSLGYYGLNSGAAGGRVNRYMASSKVEKKAQTVASRDFLHMGTHTFSLKGYDLTQCHYIYTDWTASRWLALHGIAYSKRYCRDVDLLERNAFNQAKKVFVTAEYVRDELVDIYGVPESKVLVVGTGLGGIKPFFGEKDYSRIHILFVAKERFESKGGPLMLSAFAKLREMCPDARLTIVGQNDYVDRLAIDGVEVLGHVSFEKLQELFNSHTMFALPGAHEPWGLVYLEALACKMPVVGLNKNAFPEICNYGRYGIVMDGSDSELLAAKILDLYKSPDRMGEMAKAGQQYCLSRFSWKIVVDKILAAIFD